MIQIKALSKKYKEADTFAVDAVNLAIKEGEIFGILGPNGAGKTTLISMLCSLIKPTSGTIEIHGLNYKNNKKQLKKIIGIVPQEYALYPTLTAQENLYYFGSMYGLHGTELKNKITFYLDKMGLSEFSNKKVENFSGGMKRRVNLIASIMHEPKVVFLDEPTVGVDVQSKNVIIEHLHYLNEKGATLVYTSHHLNEAENFCSRVAIIDNGKFVSQGKPKQLIANLDNATNLEDVFIALTGNELRDHA